MMDCADIVEDSCLLVLFVNAVNLSLSLSRYCYHFDSDFDSDFAAVWDDYY